MSTNAVFKFGVLIDGVVNKNGVVVSKKDGVVSKNIGVVNKNGGIVKEWWRCE